MNSLYQILLGQDFNRLAQPLQQFHSEPNQHWKGEAKVTWSQASLLRALLYLGGFPREAERAAITVRVEPQAHQERWIRVFDGRVMASQQFLKSGRLLEKVGPLSLHLDNTIEGNALRQTCPRTDLLGRPLPAWLALQVEAREWAEGERFHFDITIKLSAYLLMRYAGWLRPDT